MSIRRRSVAVASVVVFVFAVGAAVAGGPGNGKGSASCKQVLRDTFDALHADAVPLGDYEADIQELWRVQNLAEKVYKVFQTTFCDTALDPEDPCVFSNLASAEGQHRKLVEKVIKAYDTQTEDLPDSWWDTYESLIAAGSTLAGALQAGVDVEALELCQTEQVLSWALPDWDDVALIAQNLAGGDRNHLRALVAALTGLGEDYVFTCSAVDAEAIVTSEMERHVVYDADGTELASCGGPAGRGRGK